MSTIPRILVPPISRLRYVVQQDATGFRVYDTRERQPVGEAYPHRYPTSRRAAMRFCSYLNRTETDPRTPLRVR